MLRLREAAPGFQLDQEQRQVVVVATEVLGRHLPRLHGAEPVGADPEPLSGLDRGEIPLRHPPSLEVDVRVLVDPEPVAGIEPGAEGAAVPPEVRLRGRIRLLVEPHAAVPVVDVGVDGGLEHPETVLLEDPVDAAFLVEVVRHVGRHDRPPIGTAPRQPERLVHEGVVPIEGEVAEREDLVVRLEVGREERGHVAEHHVGVAVPPVVVPVDEVGEDDRVRRPEIAELVGAGEPVRDAEGVGRPPLELLHGHRHESDVHRQTARRRLEVAHEHEVERGVAGGGVRPHVEVVAQPPEVGDQDHEPLRCDR